MKRKSFHSISTIYMIIAFFMFKVSCISPNKFDNENDDYFKIEIGKDLLNLELFNAEEIASIADQGNFNAIDHFVQHSIKADEEIVGFEDDFTPDDKGFFYEYEYNHQDSAKRRQVRNNYDADYKDKVNKAFLGSNITYEYDYDKFKDEYYNNIPIEPPNLANNTRTSNFSKLDKTGKKEDIFEKEKEEMIDCSTVGKDNFGWKGIKCTWYDIKQSRNSSDYRNAGYRAGGIIWFWFKVYCAIAIVLWIFKGWCCCCFVCKFCKTKQIIEDIKYFMINNPPGIIRHSDGIVSRYKPTNKELESYKHLEKEIYFNV